MFLQEQMEGISDPRKTLDSAIKEFRSLAKEWTPLGDRCNSIDQRLATSGIDQDSSISGQFAQSNDPRANFRRIERRELWLWVAAGIITLLLTIGLASFLLPNASQHQDFYYPKFVASSHPGPGGLGIPVRPLHYLSTSADSPDPQTDGGTGRVVPLDQRERRRFDCGGGHGGTTAFQQSFLSEGLGLFPRGITSVFRFRTDSPG